MIVDLQEFTARERPYWQELDELLTGLEGRRKLALKDVRRLHYVYQRTCSDLDQVKTFTFDDDLQAYLEGLVARAYSLIHQTHQRRRFRPLHWFVVTFPGTVRRHHKALLVAAAAMLFGALLGGTAVGLDDQTKDVVIGPFEHLLGDPSERVAKEEETAAYQGSGPAGTAFYFTHNSRVAFAAMAFGLTWGIGTLVMLFYNGVILGGVAVDYVLAGEGTFLLG